MSETSNRGGMAANPFGGKTRLDRLDLMQFLGSGTPDEKIIYLATIQDAVHNYLFFALGRNGTSAEEFAAASEYFFHIRSHWPESWCHCHHVKTTTMEAGKRHVQIHDLSDEELMNMCFDRHYEYAGLDRLMTMDRFLACLKRERCAILTKNWDQVLAYVETLRHRDLGYVPTGEQLPLRIWASDEQAILVEPTGPQQVAEFLYYSRQVKQLKKTPLPPATPPQPKYVHLLELGVFNHDEDVSDNCPSGIPCPAD
jgi:hypothetical protein